MQEPQRSGRELLAATQAPVSPGEVGVWPLGQSGVLLVFPRARVYIDLYLSNHCEAVLPLPFDHRRMSRAPLDPAEITDADIVICSHDHLDHLDVPTLRTLAKSSPNAIAVAPAASRAVLEELGWEPSRVRTTRGDDSITVGDVVISAFPVAHDEYVEDDAHGHHFQGYVLQDGHISVAHVGDARADMHLVERLATFRPDLLCLPINGRDAARREMGFAGNMNAEEALQLAIESHAAHVLPMHYDMFEQNVDANALQRFRIAADSPNAPTVVRPALGAGTIVRTYRESELAQIEESNTCR